MQEVLRLDSKLREAAIHEIRSRPRPALPLEAQIFPTELALNVAYFPSATHRLPITIVGSRGWDTRQTID